MKRPHKVITTKELFNNLYEIYQGYNYIECDDVIYFDYLDAKDCIQTIKYIKDENKLMMFTFED